MSSNPWLAFTKPRPHARVRLFCFPFAGGAASAYRTWNRDLPDSIDVCPVQLPGRETRMREPLLRDMPSLVAALAEGLKQYDDLPYAIFGHSMGARIGFELARHWRRSGRGEPRHFFASAARPPSRGAGKTIRHLLSDALLTEQIRQIGGTHELVLQDQALMQIFLPILRADFMLHETYRYLPDEPLTCGLTVLAGEHDEEVSLAELQFWRQETLGEFTCRSIPAGHLFLQTGQPHVLQTICEMLMPWM